MKLKTKTLTTIAMAAALVTSAASYAASKMYVTVYYADASYSQIVGEKEDICPNGNPGVYTWGSTSSYSKRYYLGWCGGGDNR